MPDTPALSDDARAVIGCLFRLPTTETFKVTFNTPSRITPRAKAALDELVAARILRVRSRKGRGPEKALDYTAPGVAAREIAKGVSMAWLKKHGNFPLTHPGAPA